MPIIKKPFTLAPLNDNPVVLTGNGDNMTVSGGFSHKQGFPTVKFSIPPQPTMLEISTLKLVGQIIVKQADNTAMIAANNSVVYGNGIAADTNGIIGTVESLDNGMVPQTALNLPNWGGVKNVIDKVVVQSKKSLIELTSINNYGQYVGLTEAYNNNDDDYRGIPVIKSLSAGNHAKDLNRRLLTCCSYNGGDTRTNNPAVNPGSATFSGNAGMDSLSGGANDRMIGQFFSIPIQIDLLGQQNLMLDDDYLGGLLLTLHLAPDAAVFHNRFARSNGNHVAPNDASGLNYVLKNLRLEGRYIVPDDNDMAMIAPTISLDSRLNLINDVHSSVNANAYTPQLQSVKSVVNVFLDNDQTNTYTKNQNNFRRVPGEKAVQQARNGLRFPNNFEMENKPNFESVVDSGNGVTGQKNLQFPALSIGDAEIRKHFERSLLNGMVPYHTSANLETTNNAMKAEDDDALAANDAKNDNTAADCVGIGADYTLGVGLTQNFVNQDYNLTIRSGVNTGNAALSNERNGSGSSNPLLQQTFIRYNSQFDSQNLVKVI